MDELMLLENPRYRARRRKRRRNPGGFLGNPARALALPATAREWTQGIGIMEGVSGAAGLAAALLIPGFIIKDTATFGMKFGKMAIAVGAALGAGAAAKAFIGSDAGKAAVIGGIAGVVAQGVEMVTGRSIIGRPGGGGFSRRIGKSEITYPGLPSQAVAEGFQASVT